MKPTGQVDEFQRLIGVPKDGPEQWFKDIQQQAMAAWEGAMAIRFIEDDPNKALVGLIDECAEIGRKATDGRKYLEDLRMQRAEELACEITCIARWRREWPKIKQSIRYIIWGEV